MSPPSFVNAFLKKNSRKRWNHGADQLSAVSVMSHAGFLSCLCLIFRRMNSHISACLNLLCSDNSLTLHALSCFLYPPIRRLNPHFEWILANSAARVICFSRECESPLETVILLFPEFYHTKKLHRLNRPSCECPKKSFIFYVIFCYVEDSKPRTLEKNERR